MEPLIHKIDREVSIRATPDTVFRFFTDSARWASWWGAGSTIDARPGGRILIRYPEGTEALGEVVELEPPERIVFSYGYKSGTPFPPGATQVTIRLEPQALGTRLYLTHALPDSIPAEARDANIQGWRYQLSVFANVIANEVFDGAAQIVDAWYEGWTVTDPAAREAIFSRIAAPQITFRDRHSNLEGVGDLLAHTAAAQRFRPGVGLARRGELRQCQGVVLSDWVARAGAQDLMTGTSVFTMAPDGRIESVVGISNPIPPASA